MATSIFISIPTSDLERAKTFYAGLGWHINTLFTDENLYRQNLPRIPTNILSDRLKELQHAGVIRRLPLAHGLAYAITEHGRDLEPVILGLARWGLRSLSEPAHGDLPTPDSLTVDLLAAGDIHAHGARRGPGAARPLQRNLRGGPGATGVGVAVGRGVGIRSDRVDDDSVTDADGRTGDRA